MDSALLISVLSHVVTGLPLLVAALVILAAARKVFSLTLPFDAAGELRGRQNAAYGVVLAAYLLGAALAIVGTFFGRRQDPVWVSVVKMLAEGALAIVMLRGSIWVNDRFILHRFPIAKEIGRDRNLGVGFCVAGSCLACGLILNGAFTGLSAGFLHGLRDAALYGVLGQAVLVGSCRGYAGTRRHDVHRLIEYDDNVAVGIGFGGFLTGLGIVVRSALVGSGGGPLGTELMVTTVLAVLGAALLLAFHSLIVRLLLPESRGGEEVEMRRNIAVAAAAACVTVAVALFIGSIIQR